MAVARRVNRTFVTVGSVPVKPPPVVSLPEMIVYKGYRIEPESYSVNSTAWSPRVVVSLSNAAGGSRKTPLYATSAAKFSSREEADRQALDVAKAWVDAAVDRRRD
ncbi:MAG: hypothetical protein HY216_11025 [Candidatus Rokubacteria bacterium]|nr:hypothetical protein [Candidatus Rokubacteria bacterium]